jgi:acyl-CoA reductase-like NAD-dependent aldehyde dehydrogenase
MTKNIQLISPVDGQVWLERPALTLEAAQAVAARAKAAQPGWVARSLEERIALVKAGVANLNAMKDVLVEELAWQMGRPTRYGGEFGGVNDRTNYMADIAAATLSPSVVEDSDRFDRRISREPVGVVFIIAPWNYPYLTTINTLAPALIAGNTVVLKHATQTLKVGERLAEAFHAALATAQPDRVLMAAQALRLLVG